MLKDGQENLAETETISQGSLASEQKSNSFFKKYWPWMVLMAVVLVAVGIILWCLIQCQISVNNTEIIHQPRDVSADMSDWQTYRNEEYRFEFKYPDSFDIDIDFNIYDWTGGAEPGPVAFYYNSAKVRWQNRLKHKDNYIKGDKCVSPDDVAPITSYDITEVGCFIYQLENNYIIKYIDPDSIDYIVIFDKGEIVFSFPVGGDGSVDQIFSTFRFLDREEVAIVGLTELLRNEPEEGIEVVLKGVIGQCSNERVLPGHGCRLSGAGGGTTHLTGVDFSIYEDREIVVRGNTQYCENKGVTWFCGLTDVELLSVSEIDAVNCLDYRYGSCPEGCIKRCISSGCQGNICTDDCGGEGSCINP